MGLINSLADVRPGDIMFTNIGGIVPGIFPVKFGQLLLGERVRLGPLSIDHVGVVVTAQDSYESENGETRVQPAQLVQAMPRGAEEVLLPRAEYWRPGVAFVRMVEDYPGQAEEAARIARLFVVERVPYSFGSYAALAAWRYGLKVDRLERWIDRRREPIEGVRLPAEAICSVLADQVWTLAGKHVMPDTARQVVTPGALALQLWKTLPRENWGGAGLG